MNGADTEGDAAQERRSDQRKKAPRPEVQIYRPGMLRRGVDITLNPPINPEDEAPSRNRGSRGLPRSPAKDRFEYRTYENSNRRKHREEAKNGDSGSTTPESHPDDYRRPRGGSRGSRRGGPPSEHSFNGSRDDLRSETSYATRASGYNSTQSLLDPRPRPGGYLDQPSNQRYNDRQRRDQGPESARQLGRMNRQGFERNTDRASMRAEGVQRRRGAAVGSKGSRNRNDSLNSTQSERPASLYIDTTDRHDETRSVGGAPSEAPSSTGLSFAELCASFDSMGSMNWSEMVQEDFAAESAQVRSNDAKELKARLQSSHDMGEQRREGAPRGILMRGGYTQRSRKDSDRSSSVADSIVEERSDSESRDETFGEESERDGESTPTRAASPSLSEPIELELDEAMRNLPNLRPSAKGRWKDRISYVNDEQQEREKDKKRLESTENIKKTARLHTEEVNKDPMQRFNRLKGRISLKNAEPYQPPAMRIKEKSTTASSDSTPRQSIDENRERSDHSTMPKVISNREETLGEGYSRIKPIKSKEPENTRIDPTYKKAKEEFGNRIAQLNQNIDTLMPEIAARNVSAAQRMEELSSVLSEIYYNFLTKDVVFTFTMNLETHLWKQAYYKIIEALKSGSNSLRETAGKLRDVLRSVITNGISYYKRVILLYEKEFSLKVSDALFWPNGLPSDDLKTLHDGQHPILKYESKLQKAALKSLARHYVSLGNLHRYLAIVEASEDFGRSLSSYLCASQLWPESGQTYNQLAILAYNMMLYRSRVRTRLTPVECLSDQRQARVIEETFFLSRAIAATYSFESARDRMSQRLSAMIRKVEKYEPILDKEFGKSKDEYEVALQKDHPVEMWVRKDGRVVKKDDDEFLDDELITRIMQQSASTVHRRCISYLIGVVAMLYTKINLNQFTSISSRALAFLAASLNLDDSRITSLQLAKLTSIFIFLIHNAETTKQDDTLTYQQQLCFSFFISFFGVLLRPIAAAKSNISTWLSKKEYPNRNLIRIMPSLTLISNWICTSFARKTFQIMSTLNPLKSAFFQVETWRYLEETANALSFEDKQGHLLSESTMENPENIIKILPELNLVSGFCEIFLSPPAVFHVSSENESLQEYFPIHCRLRSLMNCADVLSKNDYGVFEYHQQTKRFIYTSSDEGIANAKEAAELADQVSTLTMRENLMEHESKKRSRVLLVRPLQLVPDTNGFVDHLELINKLVVSENYTILVPTTVVEELTGLALAPRPSESEEHASFVHAQAKVAVQWLKEKRKSKAKSMGLLTTKGEKVPLTMLNEENAQGELRQINDDRIVNSCHAFAETCVLPPMTSEQLQDLPNDAEVILRGIVLLTEDRGVQIKASIRNIPTRTLHSFVKWANL